MIILLKPELEQYIAEEIKAGRFSDPSDVVNEALQAFKEQEKVTGDHEEYLRREVNRGLEQLDRGERHELDMEKIIADQRRLKSSKAG